MKKVLKVFGACLLMCGVIALIVCMCAIPNETKAFFDIVVEYLDKPIVLCGVSITIGGVLLYFIARYILSNTSIGKKNLMYLEKKIDNKCDVNMRNINELRKETEENFRIDNKSIEDIAGLCEKLEKALSLIPNKKVQEVLNNGEETKDN